LLDDEAAPLGLLAADEPPLVLPLAPPLELPLVPPLELPMPPPLEDDEPVPGLLGLELLELDEPGELGAVAVDEDDEPPGTTTVSRSFVLEVVELAEPLGAVLLPPGTTVVVSLRSQADNARAPISTNR
jgi:hypothetical protein